MSLVTRLRSGVRHLLLTCHLYIKFIIKFSKSEWSLSSSFKPLLFEQTVLFWVDMTYVRGYLPPRKPGLSILVEVSVCHGRHENRQGLRRIPVIQRSSQIIQPGALRLCVLRGVWTGISIIHSQLVPEIN
jgi:hypothetical protein